MATFLFTFFRCGILEAQRCYISLPSKVITAEWEDFPLFPGQCCSDVLISKDKPPMVLGTAICAPIPHSELRSPQLHILWATDKRRGKEGNYILIKEKLGALYSQNSFSIQFPKKNPLAENKHWKNFQISVRTLSLSLWIPFWVFLSFCLSFCLCFSLFFSLGLCLHLSLYSSSVCFGSWEKRAMWILKQFTLNQMVHLISIRLKRHIT